MSNLSEVVDSFFINVSIDQAFIYQLDKSNCKALLSALLF